MIIHDEIRPANVKLLSPVRPASDVPYPIERMIDNGNLFRIRWLGGFVTQIPQNKTVLVTGAGGRLGRLLRRAASRDGTGGWRFVFQSRTSGTGLTWAPGDDLWRLPRCGCVIALWGATDGAASDLALNETLVRTSHAVAAACGAGHVFHASSAAVYGPGRGLRETDPPRPSADYGRSKLAMERAVAALPADGIRHCCLRLANVVGADSLAPALTRARPVDLDRVEGGGGPVRSYIAASDVLRVLCGLAALPLGRLPPVLNVAAPRPTPMEALALAAGRDIAWRPAPATAIRELTIDAQRLAKLLPALDHLSAPEAMIADWHDLERMT